jgi:O-6-methylguanine DNA methyltransferase
LPPFVDVPDLAEETYRLLRQVPRGMVTTYGALAEALGAKEAARLVGEYMAKNPYAPEVPCHRVVLSDGKVGKYSSPRGTVQKVELLAGEGVAVCKGMVVDFSSRLFRDFKGPRPLEKLRSYQLSLLPKLSIKDYRDPPSSLLAVDVAYTDIGAFAAGAFFGLRENRPGPTVSLHTAVDFPYIPTFLGFREIPAVKAVLDSLPKRPDMLLIDGNGTLHAVPQGNDRVLRAGDTMTGRLTMTNNKQFFCEAGSQFQAQATRDWSPYFYAETTDRVGWTNHLFDSDANSWSFAARTHIIHGQLGAAVRAEDRKSTRLNSSHTT